MSYFKMLMLPVALLVSLLLLSIAAAADVQLANKAKILARSPAATPAPRPPHSRLIVRSPTTKQDNQTNRSVPLAIPNVDGSGNIADVRYLGPGNNGTLVYEVLYTRPGISSTHTATQAENAHSLALVGVEHVGRDNSTGQVSTVIAVAECGFDNGLGRTGYCSVVPQAPPGAGPTTTFFAGATLLTATTTVATPTPTSTSRPNGSRDPPGLNPSSAGKRVVASSVLTAVVTAAPVVSLLAALLQ